MTRCRQILVSPTVLLIEIKRAKFNKNGTLSVGRDGQPIPDQKSYVFTESLIFYGKKYMLCGLGLTPKNKRHYYAITRSVDSTGRSKYLICDDENIEVIKNSQEGRRIFNKKNSQEVVFLAYEAISVDDNVDKQVNLNLK